MQNLINLAIPQTVLSLQILNQWPVL